MDRRLMNKVGYELWQNALSGWNSPAKDFLKFTEEGKTAKQEAACCLLLVNLMRHSGMETSSITEK